MDDRRAELADREAQVWGRFEAAALRIPRDRWRKDGVLPGWSVNDLLWHVAGWIDRCAEILERLREGHHDGLEETDEQVDAMNEAFAAAARTMEAEAIWTGLTAARELVRRRWQEIPEVDADAVEWFAGETFEHYEEHLADLERFAG